jgi:hypothetical protein
LLDVDLVYESGRKTTNAIIMCSVSGGQPAAGSLRLLAAAGLLLLLLVVVLGHR